MNQNIQRILSNDKIPSPPAVAAKLLDLVSQAEVGIDDIACVLGSDPNLSARLISYCNSPIVGSKRAVANLPQAVMVLGLRKLRLLSLSFSLMQTNSDSDFDYDVFWRRSLATAVTSKTLAAHYKGDVDEMFLLGLVLNVGQIGIGNALAEEAQDLRGTKPSEIGISAEQELEIFGMTRFQIGGKMLEKWHFPTHMSDTVSEFDVDDLNAQTERLHLSLCLGELLLCSEPSESTIASLRESSSRILGVDNAEFDYLFDKLIAEWKNYEQLFEYDAIEFQSIRELEERARQSVIELSLKAISELEEEKRDLEESALIDSLTSLKNRRAYEAELPSVASYHSRMRKSFGVLVIDIDYFKTFNDTHGHTKGDAALRNIGVCLATRARAYDNVYRYGGEEFVVVVQDCAQDDMLTVAERLRSEIELLDIDGLKVTASIGGCWTHGCEFNDFSELFIQADKQLYIAKHQGRNRCVTCKFEPERPKGNARNTTPQQTFC